MRKIVTLLSLIISFMAVHAQNGEISGKVADEGGEGIPFANVVLVDDKGISTGRGTTTDMDGNYSIKPLTPGKYNLQFSYVGYASKREDGIVVNSDKATFIDIKLKTASKELATVEIVSYKVPLIDPGKTSSQNTVTAEEIADMSTKNISDIAATTAGVFQSDQGGGLNVKGARSEGTQYYVDGIKISGVATIPASSIEQLQVITGGVPAKYGDLTGGIVNITSKGPSNELSGGVEVQTTQGLDAYGYNLVNGSLTGPIWKEKKSKKTIIGFFTTFEYVHQDDPNPSAIGVRPNVLDSLQQFPLLKPQGSQGFDLRAENVTFADMFKQLVKPNTKETDLRANGRIDIRPADNITVTIGGAAVNTQYHEWVPQYTLFNPVDNPIDKNLDWRIYGRFTHNIQSKQSQEDEKEGKKKASAFQNAYYTVQIDYEKNTASRQDPSAQFNAFDYGYIGKFQTKQSPVFTYDTFAVGNGHVLTGYKQTGFQDTAISFTPGNVVPTATRYTTQYYQLLDAQQNSDGSYEVYNSNNSTFTQNLNDIQQNRGLINGYNSPFVSANIVNNLWYNTGRQVPGYSFSDNDQYRARLEGAFDILKPGAPSRNKHSIEFGIEYEQRIDRSYSLSAPAVWALARQYANDGIANLDYSNPILRINGQNYSYNSPNRPAFYYTDTLLFNRTYSASQQSYFDQQLRTSLGMPVNSTTFIDVDNLNPDQLNIKMFSPAELLNSGSSIVGYQGYDPYGNVLKTQPTFNDFFTKVDANGNPVRGIPAFTPIDAAAYISDRFYFKDLTFNVGVRFERFDANQEVLIDPYTLYPIYDAAQAATKGFNIPSDIGSNYAVYVDNSNNPQAIVGFRNGSTWYDRYGNQLASGALVAQESSTGAIQPFLKNPNEDITNPALFDPNGTFQQFVPKILVLPRLQFSFNLTDKALFFAHYDVLAQRPGGQDVEAPTQYLYFNNLIGAVLNNPDLQPQRVIDYELGFKQKVSNTSAFTISAFYREYRDQIQVEKIIDAYPKDYITYGNIDFGTTKGFTLDYDMRRTGNFSLKANYTMQFASGTGSDETSQLGLISSNQPNFRTIAPLDYDSRHTINLNVTWSYGQGKDYNGPVIKNKQILSDAGVSFQFTARSGTPYTEQTAATATQLFGSPTRAISEGSINGSRIPWYFRVNMRVWKDFNFNAGKKKENKRALSLQIYLQIQNLLNTQNILAVYRFTGTPNDDGYLSSPSSAPAIAAALNPQAYKDQYAAAVNSPSNYSLPRRIYLGGIFNF